LSIGIYMDVHVPYQISVALRLRGVDVLTAQEDGAAELADPELLDRATSLRRILFSQDKDLLREAHRRQRAGEVFLGVLYAAQIGLSYSQCIDGLEIIAKCSDPSDWTSAVDYLPL